MKEIKHIYNDCAGDVFKLEIDLTCADVEITGAENGALVVSKLKHSHIKTSVHDGVLRIKQTRKPFFHRAAVKISIPAHCVPDVNANIKQGKLAVTGGLYGDLTVRCGTGRVSLGSCSFINCDVSGSDLKLGCGDVSVKRCFIANVAEGEILVENSFCYNLDAVIKSGNFGATALKTRDSSVIVERGCVNLILDGAAENYSLNLLSKNGTCNRESAAGGKIPVKAYAGCGNISIDFTQIKEVDYGNDNVAENSRVACGA